jgi:hypothetical protein
MGNGELPHLGPEQEHLSTSLLDALKQRLEGKKRTDKDFALKLLQGIAVFDFFSKKEISLIIGVAKKIKKWEDVDTFLRRQGPLSTDDPVEFTLTDDEIDVLLNMHRKLGSSESEIDSVESTYRASLQNPLPLQITQFYRSSKRIFKIPHDRFEEFSSGDYMNICWTDVIKPHEAFGVEFAKPLVFGLPGERKIVVSGLLVTELNGIDPTYPENTFQVRVISPNSFETQELYQSFDDTEHERIKRNAEKAFEEMAYEKLRDKVKEKTKRKVAFWREQLEIVANRERMLNEPMGSTIEVDIHSSVDPRQHTATDVILKTIAGMCLYLANSGMHGTAHAEQSIPGNIEQITIESSDKTQRLPLTPAEHIEMIRKRNSAAFIEPHPRRGHPRTLHRGTPKERTIEIDPTTVKGRMKKLPKAFTFGVTSTQIKSTI